MNCECCLDGDVVARIDDQNVCERCLAAIRESLGSADTEPAMARTENVPRETEEDLDTEIRLAKLSASLDMIADARRFGIEPAGLLKAVREHAARRAEGGGR